MHDNMTKKKNHCQKCAVHHCAPTGKKCTRLEEITEKVIESEVGTRPNGAGLLVLPLDEQKRPIIADHLTPAVRMDAVEG